VLDVISKRMPGEPYYAPPLPRPLAAEVGADPGRLRVGVLDRPGTEASLDDPQCRAAVAGAARLLESLGHHVEPSAPAAMFEEEFGGNFGTIIAADSEATLQAFEMLLGRPIADDEIEPRNVGHRRAGRELSAVAYLQTRAWLAMWARRMADWWNDHDLLVTPTLGAPPPELGWFTAAGPEQEGPRIASFIPYTAQFNMTGQPAISLPLHWTPDGLPVGVQLAAAYGREDILIRVASQLEQAAPWSDRRPPVHAVLPGVWRCYRRRLGADGYWAAAASQSSNVVGVSRAPSPGSRTSPAMSRPKTPRQVGTSLMSWPRTAKVRRAMSTRSWVSGPATSSFVRRGSATAVSASTAATSA
jgi:amidase